MSETKTRQLTVQVQAGSVKNKARSGNLARKSIIRDGGEKAHLTGSCSNNGPGVTN